MSFYKKYILLVASLVVWLAANAYVVEVRVVDKVTGFPLEHSSVFLKCGSISTAGLTDSCGVWRATVAKGEWSVNVASVGYGRYTSSISVDGNKRCVVSLMPLENALHEIVVTAREGRGATSVSLINRDAMSHLQPSSFTDLLELLPGGVSKDPEMGKANLANLREARNITTSGYETSSLGTSFVVDGVPMNTNADMLNTSDSNQSGRITSGKGVDMRSLSTDDIESVEVVRGIASAQYGEVTSGVINIKRKKGISRLEARFKADIQSQLFYIGKGFKMPGDDWTMNVSLDYLDSKIDPRNTRENFKRVNGSIRSNKDWKSKQYITSWNSSLNYVGTFERDKNDPDLTVNGTRDYYTSDKNNISWNNSLTINSRGASFLRTISATTGVSYSSEQLYQEKTVASNRLYPMPIATTPGEHNVGFLPMVYDAELTVDSKPVTAFAKLNAKMQYSLGASKHVLNVGSEWNFSKNYGDGQVYDLMRPITAGNNSRPRAYSDVPAMNQLSVYAENQMELHLGENSLNMQVGVRETQLLHLDKQYLLRNRPYFDPRVNMQWRFPQLQVAGETMVFELCAGVGWHTKMPVAAYLFPDLRYTDYAQLNYYHDIEKYRVMNVRTFVEDITNYSLKAARNLKWELRGDISYMGNRFSVTYFRENMTNGFRQTGVVHTYTYNKYDASAFDPIAADRAPEISELPSEKETRLVVVNHVTNGSRTLKEGVEYTFSSRRIPAIRTRVTVSGAWFRTTLSNSQSLWYKPSVVLNGTELQYVGLYDDTDGSVYQSFNTNIMFDTYIPNLKLNFSLAAQNMWFTSSQTLAKDGMPTHYMGTDGVIHTYTAESATDAYLQHLIRSYSATAFDKRTVPTATHINFKVTKKLYGDRIGVSMYVNRLISIAPDYYRYGALQRRYSSPYFGMELNLKL